VVLDKNHRGVGCGRGYGGGGAAGVDLKVAEVAVAGETFLGPFPLILEAIYVASNISVQRREG
jgi:hypothetical protein